MELVIRATLIYFFLWLVVRGTGKRSISELTPLELIFTFVIGDLVQQAVTGEDMSMTGGIIVIATFALWMLIGDFLTSRSKRWERILEGEAVVVLRNGEPDLARLRKERLTLDDLVGAARENGFATLDDIRFAVLEHDGKFSFVAHAPATGTP
jgi:uncharacterized membrane protein YcaP (DUF421 family)